VAFGSVIDTPVSVTLPVFVVVIVYTTVLPTAAYVGVDDVFVVVSAGVWVPFTGTSDDASDVVPPTGFVPDEFATLCTTPAFRSACVTECEAEHVIDAPGANDATGIAGVHEPSTAFASLTVTLLIVTFPVFVATIVYAIVFPTAEKPLLLVDFVVVSCGVWVDGVETDGDASDTGWFVGDVPCESATFAIPLASRSACVTVCVAEQLIDAPGANNATGNTGVHEPRTAFASVTVTAVSVTLPEFVAAIAYDTTSPTAEKPGVLDVFVVVSTPFSTDGVFTVGDVAVVVPPAGFVPETDAVFNTRPASRSACETTCDAEQTIDPPGTNTATGNTGTHEPSVAFGSVTDTFVNVTFPEFATVIV
jgi:hypothetical protein